MALSLQQFPGFEGLGVQVAAAASAAQVRCGTDRAGEVGTVTRCAHVSRSRAATVARMAGA